MIRRSAVIVFACILDFMRTRHSEGNKTQKNTEKTHQILFSALVYRAIYELVVA
jgi:hypothetical protein